MITVLGRFVVWHLEVDEALDLAYTIETHPSWKESADELRRAAEKANEQQGQYGLAFPERL
jgi:hypothetical protein